MLISVLPVSYYIYLYIYLFLLDYWCWYQHFQWYITFISTYISTYWVTGVDICTSIEVLHLSLHILVLTGLLLLISALPLRYYIYLYIYLFLLDYWCSYQHFQWYITFISTYISPYLVTGADICTSSEVLHLSLHILVLTGLLVFISALPVRYYIYLYIY